jgi:hypothetical protein
MIVLRNNERTNPMRYARFCGDWASFVPTCGMGFRGDSLPGPTPSIRSSLFFCHQTKITGSAIFFQRRL